MGALEVIGTGIYSINETKWDNTCPSFYKYIKTTIKRRDEHSKFAFTSNKEEKCDGIWKPGGNLLGVSGAWASQVEKSGNDPIGRWSWAILRSKNGNKIWVISAYLIFQSSPNQAGPLKSCQQQVRSLKKGGSSIQTLKG